MEMFCYQCQETVENKGCTKKGVCGKSAELAKLQDSLIFILKGISILITQNKDIDLENREINLFIMNGLFMTITNTNFDEERFTDAIHEGIEIRNRLKEKIIREKGELPNNLHESIYWNGNLSEKIHSSSVLATKNEDIRSLRELTIYGLKGLAAYAEHAINLGFEDPILFDFMKKALALTTDDSLSSDDLVELVLETGKNGVKAMELLDKANTSTYGNPEITKVNIGVRNNPGILISGHDLKDMEELLIQTEETGVDVYTHGEMLPAHYYPKFKKYKHFVGNYGSSWWKQREDFSSFNGPILFTTNCIVPPIKDASYANKVFTTGAAGYPGFHHIIRKDKNSMKDFSEIIEMAKKCPPPKEIEGGFIIGGFAHSQVMQLSDKIVNAVKNGAIKKFFVMAGCDGRQKSREYYTQFAEALPKDTVILTAGCAKYRYNKLDLGTISGIPRVLDAGQCNDSYSLAVIALKLKEVFGLDDINKLPIAFNIAWYEQKAVIVLLALLYLGVKNIHLGPTLPAFISPAVANVLIKNFGIAGIGTVEDDIKLFMK